MYTNYLIKSIPGVEPGVKKEPPTSVYVSGSLLGFFPVGPPGHDPGTP